MRIQNTFEEPPPLPPGFRDASLTQSHNELMKALKLALKVKKL